jgi:hypothetical protein
VTATLSGVAFAAAYFIRERSGGLKAVSDFFQQQATKPTDAPSQHPQ